MIIRIYIMDVLIIGTGEYVTGITNSLDSSNSDKKIGVVGLVFFDLKRRGFVNNITLAGTNGTKFPVIRKHFKDNVENVYKDMDTSFNSFPDDDVKSDPNAYLKALDNMREGDIVCIFTPDHIHYNMCKEAIKRKLHVLVTKPSVMKAKDQISLIKEAKDNDVHVQVEVHKRWDPMYSDAYTRIRSGELGLCNYFYSYMSQPKFQLETFRRWAETSDISYYLNSHHIDYHCWLMKDKAYPLYVFATGSAGIAHANNIDTYDTISLQVKWKYNDKNDTFIANYTASWVTPESDVHSQQRFHFLGSEGEINIDQAHRNYQLCTDNSGLKSINPLYMKYTPDQLGYFNGQEGYGYKSIEAFVRSCKDPKLRNYMPTLEDTLTSIRILEAGYNSLKTEKIIYLD